MPLNLGSFQSIPEPLTSPCLMALKTVPARLQACALYEELVRGPKGVRELEAQMIDLGFDMDSLDVFLAEDEVLYHIKQ